MEGNKTALVYEPLRLSDRTPVNPIPTPLILFFYYFADLSKFLPIIIGV